jgi:hypothetical protein
METNAESEKSSWETCFDHLVEELAYNYYACSFGDKKPKDKKNLISDLIEKREGRVSNERTYKENCADEYRTRNIVVVGAGCSMDSYSGMPGGEMLIKRFRVENEKFDDSILRRYEQDKKEIQSITGRDTLSFENYLYIMSKSYMTQPEIRKLIDDYTNFKYSPVYFNEIIAHMLKHSFIDAVINFNFEETLDQAISEEIGEGNYHNIISDGHCIDLDSITANGTMKAPIYIKPHGTNSHKSTLRFTNKHYFDIPDDISRMMKCLIGGFESSREIEELLQENKRDSRIEVEEFGHGNNGKGGKRRTIDKVNLICVGFNMESIEFLDILNSYLPTDSDIYYINFKEPEEELLTNVYYRRLAEFFISKNSNEWKKWKEKKDWERDTTKIEVQNKVKQIFIGLRSQNLGFKFIQCSDDYLIKADGEIVPLLRPEDYKKENGERVINSLNEYENSRLTQDADGKELKQKREISNWERSLPPLGRLFNYLYSDIYIQFTKLYRPQNTHRHKLTSLLFHDRLLRQPYDRMNYAHRNIDSLNWHIKKQDELRNRFEYNHNYFLDRTIVEIMIAFLRGHGAIDYFELKHGRVKTYYRLYRNAVDIYNRENASSPVNIVSLARLVLTFTNVTNKDEIALNIIKIDVLKDSNVLDNLVAAYGSAFVKNERIGIKRIIQDFLDNKDVFYREFGNKSHNRHNRRLTFTLIYKLLDHDFISNEFKQRLKASMRLKGIQRVKNERSAKGTMPYRYKELTHLQMIIHSSNYLVGNNFYSISTHNHNADLITWQSFTLDSQLHTNLKLDYELMRKLEDETENYNVVLSVSELGNNLLHNLRRSGRSILESENMYIVQICAFEAIKQFHRHRNFDSSTRREIYGKREDIEDTEAKYVSRLMFEHKKYMLGAVSDDDPRLQRIALFFIPFTLHNHHMTLFARFQQKGQPCFDFDSAIYIWRRGFSSKMTPILINKKLNESSDENDQYNTWVENDLKSLYNIFIKYLDRGFLFNVLHSVESSKTTSNEAENSIKFITDNLNLIEKASGICFRQDVNLETTTGVEYLQFLDTFDELNLMKVKTLFEDILARKLFKMENKGEKILKFPPNQENPHL